MTMLLERIPLVCCIGMIGLMPQVTTANPRPPQLETVRAQSMPLHDDRGQGLPAFLDRIQLGGNPRRTASDLGDALRGISGVQVRNRQNRAQDTQLSIRGWGARASFGIRGIRLFLDGLPVSLPDGQGQIAHVLPAAAGRLEVLRGPFSALYGNASGGVISVHTERIPKTGEALRIRTSADSIGGYDGSVRWLRRDGDLDLALTAAGFRTEGYRAHSAARGAGLNAVAGYATESGHQLDLTFQLYHQPKALDPLGLPRSRWRQEPTAAVEAAFLLDPRKSLRQHQLGAIWQSSPEDARRWRLALWRGGRVVDQFLALPPQAQTNPLSSGGVIALDHVHDGFDLRHELVGLGPTAAADLTLGLALERLHQDRRGFENFTSTRLGVRGALRRDERNRVHANGAYAQLRWPTATDGSVVFALRHSRLRFLSEDRYITDRNPDDSGSKSYRRTIPMFGYQHALAPALRGWIAAGEGFETPTLVELAYRADGNPGLAFDLRPARSRNLELGLAHTQEHMTWSLIAHASLTQDELGVVRNLGGRASFANVGDTRRRGLEAQIDWRIDPHWRLQAAAEWLDARYTNDFLLCTGAGCAQPTTAVAAGSPLPGIAARQTWLRWAWTPNPTWEFGAEVEARSALPVADGHRERAPGHALIHLDARRTWTLPAAQLSLFLRIDNLLDRRHVASVIVNESNGRYYEPGPGRSALLGLEWSTR